MKTLIIFTQILLVVACKSTQRPPEPPTEELCVTVVDPHLCLIDIDESTYGAHGTNRCDAIRKLKRVLADAGHNPLVVEKATCGRVFK